MKKIFIAIALLLPFGGVAMEDLHHHSRARAMIQQNVQKKNVFNRFGAAIWGSSSELEWKEGNNGNAFALPLKDGTVMGRVASSSQQRQNSIVEVTFDDGLLKHASIKAKIHNNKSIKVDWKSALESDEQAAHMLTITSYSSEEDFIKQIYERVAKEFIPVHAHLERELTPVGFIENRKSSTVWHAKPATVEWQELAENKDRSIITLFKDSSKQQVETSIELARLSSNEGEGHLAMTIRGGAFHEVKANIKLIDSEKNTVEASIQDGQERYTLAISGLAFYSKEDFIKKMYDELVKNIAVMREKERQKQVKESVDNVLGWSQPTSLFRVAINKHITASCSGALSTEVRFLEEGNYFEGRTYFESPAGTSFQGRISVKNDNQCDIDFVNISGANNSVHAGCTFGENNSVTIVHNSGNELDTISLPQMSYNSPEQFIGLVYQTIKDRVSKREAAMGWRFRTGLGDQPLVLNVGRENPVQAHLQSRDAGVYQINFGHLEFFDQMQINLQMPQLDSYKGATVVWKFSPLQKEHRFTIDNADSAVHLMEQIYARVSQESEQLRNTARYCAQRIQTITNALRGVEHIDRMLPGQEEGAALEAINAHSTGTAKNQKERVRLLGDAEHFTVKTNKYEVDEDVAGGRILYQNDGTVTIQFIDDHNNFITVDCAFLRQENAEQRVSLNYTADGVEESISLPMIYSSAEQFISKIYDALQKRIEVRQTKNKSDELKNEVQEALGKIWINSSNFNNNDIDAPSAAFELMKNHELPAQQESFKANMRNLVVNGFHDLTATERIVLDDTSDYFYIETISHQTHFHTTGKIIGGGRAVKVGDNKVNLYFTAVDKRKVRAEVTFGRTVQIESYVEGISKGSRVLVSSYRSPSELIKMAYDQVKEGAGEYNKEQIAQYTRTLNDGKPTPATDQDETRKIAHLLTREEPKSSTNVGKAKQFAVQAARGVVEELTPGFGYGVSMEWIKEKIKEQDKTKEVATECFYIKQNGSYVAKGKIAQKREGEAPYCVLYEIYHPQPHINLMMRQTVKEKIVVDIYATTTFMKQKAQENPALNMVLELGGYDHPYLGIPKIRYTTLQSMQTDPEHRDNKRMSAAIERTETYELNNLGDLYVDSQEALVAEIYRIIQCGDPRAVTKKRVQQEAKPRIVEEMPINDDDENIDEKPVETESKKLVLMPEKPINPRLSWYKQPVVRGAAIIAGVSGITIAAGLAIRGIMRRIALPRVEQEQFLDEFVRKVQQVRTGLVSVELATAYFNKRSEGLSLSHESKQQLLDFITVENSGAGWQEAQDVAEFIQEACVPEIEKQIGDGAFARRLLHVVRWG